MKYTISINQHLWNFLAPKIYKNMGVVDTLNKYKNRTYGKTVKEKEKKTPYTSP